LTTKEFDLARTAAAGAVHLAIGKMVSFIVSGLGGLAVIRLLTHSEYGLFNIALVAPGIFALFCDFQTNLAMVKYLAEFRSKGKVGNLKPLVYSNLQFHIFLGVGLTLACYLTADLFATVAIGKPEVSPLIRVAAIYIMAQVLHGFAESLFIGLDATKLYAFFLILSTFLNTILPVVLILYGMGILGALLGWVLAIIIAGGFGVVASLLLLNKISNGLVCTSNPDFGFKDALKKLLVFGIPLTAAFFITSGLGRFYDFMIAAYCNPGDIGNFSAVSRLTSALLYLTFPISTVLFPAFSKINPVKEPVALKKVYVYSVKYSSFIILPAVTLMMTLARPLVIFLFGVEYENSWIYLMLLATSWVFYGLGKAHLWALLSAQGEVKLVAGLNVLDAAIGCSLGLILIPTYGVIGLILIGFVSWWPSYIIAFKRSRKKYEIKPPLKEVARIYLSIAIAGFIVALINLSFLSDLLRIALGALTGAVAYFLIMPITGAIKEGDIKALRDITGPQPILGVIADRALKIMERVRNLRR